MPQMSVIITLELNILIWFLFQTAAAACAVKGIACYFLLDKCKDFPS